ncbi:hypothetical protein [Maricaulis sp.]|uniref:hypothetical protein n=1 Tax=Maricaulis sp. TaxID=1486257 RepID=UPI003A91AB58
MKRFLVAGLAAAGLAFTAGAASAQDQTDPAAAPADTGMSQDEPVVAEAEPVETQVAEEAEEEVICRWRRQTGSNFRERLCMTRRQTEQAEEAAERSLRRMRRGQAFSPN